MSKELEALENMKNRLIDAKFTINGTTLYSKNKNLDEDYKLLCEALQRLAKYEQILGNGRLTDRNYKNTTLDLDSCKPYLRLGQLKDIYEEGND